MYAAHFPPPVRPPTKLISLVCEQAILGGGLPTHLHPKRACVADYTTFPINCSTPTKELSEREFRVLYAISEGGPRQAISEIHSLETT